MFILKFSFVSFYSLESILNAINFAFPYSSKKYKEKNFHQLVLNQTLVQVMVYLVT